MTQIPEEYVLDNDPDVFWTYLYRLEDGQFHSLAHFALNVMAFPHSNAQCERIFSKINCTKTKSRNRMICKTVSATLTTSECIKNNGRVLISVLQKI